MKIRLLVISLLLTGFDASAIAAASPGWVIAWGYDGNGQVTGTPSQQASTGLVRVANEVLSNIVAVSIGQRHCLALKSDGTVVGWGVNEFGEATGTKSNHESGGVVRIGNETLRDAIAISAGAAFSLALKRDGTVVAWGATDILPMDAIAGLTNVVSIAAGFRSGFVIKSDGTVFGWSYPHLPRGLDDLAQITVAKNPRGHVLALTRDGSIIGFGGEAIPSQEMTNNVAIAAGELFSLVLKNDGTVFGWGSKNDRGQATGAATFENAFGRVKINNQLLTNVVAISASNENSMALKNDGTVTVWGNNWYNQTNVPVGLGCVVAIAAGECCLAITTNAAVAERFMRKEK